jgi:hypothetical protein
MNKLSVLIVAGLILACSSTTGWANLTEGLVGYWSFDDPADPGHDDSGNGNDGTLHGPTWTTDNFGGALNFDGVDDYVKVADDDSLDITDRITLSAWVKPSDAIGSEFVVAKWGGVKERKSSYGFRLADANPRFFLSGGNVKTTKTFTDLIITENSWNHIAVTWDGNRMKAYLNGTASSQERLFTGLINATSEPVVIGYNADWGGGVGGDYFDGTIDEVRIYNRALSDSEIMALVPEPSTLAFLGLGALALRRRKR